MSTNDRKYIRTVHVPTGRKVDFYLSPDISPSITYKVDQRDQLRKKAERIRADKQADQLSDDDRQKLAEIYGKVTRLGIQIYAMILEPVQEVPDEYENKFDYVADCAQNDFVIDRVINFYYSSLSSSTPSPEDKEFQEYRRRLESQVEILDSPAHTSPSSSSATSGG